MWRHIRPIRILSEYFQRHNSLLLRIIAYSFEFFKQTLQLKQLEHSKQKYFDSLKQPTLNEKKGRQTVA